MFKKDLTPDPSPQGEGRRESELAANSEQPEHSDLSEHSDNTEQLEQPEQSENPEQLLDPVEQAYCLGAGIDSETLADAKALLHRIAEAVTTNKFDPELLQTAIRVLNFDKLLEQTRNEAYASAREEKMAEAFRDKRSKAEEAASIPHFGGTKGIGAFKGESIFDVARKAGSR